MLTLDEALTMVNNAEVEVIILETLEESAEEDLIEAKEAVDRLEALDPYGINQDFRYNLKLREAWQEEVKAQERYNEASRKVRRAKLYLMSAKQLLDIVKEKEREEE